jgi:hypothetical protein
MGLNRRSGKTPWRGNLNTNGFACLFCDKECGPKDSFKHINIATGTSDTFHMDCFRRAVDNMITMKKSEKANESKNDPKNI